ncbi:patatin-like phospholipase family protein [Halalkalicoccus paucihalophilus]|uniref:patatin-like phospholipase family protein n=1 Tax=Halalkalicoccus paucihalophilus TaxID=1008153 RepID=UPI0034A432EE
MTARLDPGGLLTPSLSPYLVLDGSIAHQQLSTILSEHIGFDEFQQLLATDNQPPRLFVGAVDPLNGYPATFTNEGVTLDALLASTALPTLFRAVEINDRPYWDGVFAQNPPIRQFVTTAALPPIDELWIVQLTPQSVDETPTTTEAIADRMAQLVGNLSLQHERVFIEIVSEWAANGYLPEDRFATTTIRTIALPQDKAAASTVDRRRSFVESLFADGRTEAIHLLEQLEIYPHAVETWCLKRVE